MIDPSPAPLFLDKNPVAVPVPKAVQQAYLWAMAGLGGAAAIALFVFAVATQSTSDAERIAGARSDSTLSVMMGSLTATHGRPGAL